MTFSITMFCHCAECRVLFIIMLNVSMLSVVARSKMFKFVSLKKTERERVIPRDGKLDKERERARDGKLKRERESYPKGW